MKNYRENFVGVFGDPVDENPTGAIEQAGFDYLGIPFRFLTIKVKEGDLENAVKGMRAMNFSGIGVTMPHKQSIIKYLDEISRDASIIGAVNTVYWKDGKLFGENVDGKGFMMSLKDNNIEAEDKNIVVLGAGGAASAIAVELALAGAKNITIVNIDEAQGMRLVNSINDNTEAKAVFALWKGTYTIPENTDILINATSIGFIDGSQCPDIDYNSYKKDTVVCDVIPNKTTTLFLDRAKEKGCHTINGLSMLVNQGTLCFELWTGEKAPLEVMTNAVKREFNITD